MVSGRVTRWENLEGARAAFRDAVGDGEAAARRAHAMCNPHARVRTAGMAGRGIYNPPYSVNTQGRLSFRPPQPGEAQRADQRHTMSFSSCAAAFTLVDDDGVFLGRGWALWCTRGAARSAGR